MIYLGAEPVGITRDLPNTSIIDDTAGAGDTDKTWSADKLSNLQPQLDIATVEETQAIIDEYSEEDEDMIFETAFVNNGSYDVYYETTEDASVIAAAYQAGKHVSLHFPTTTGMGCFESVISLVAYEAENTVGMQQAEKFTLAKVSGDRIGGNIMPNNVSVGNNGKLCVQVYVD